MKAPEVPPAPEEVPGVLPERVDIVLAEDLSSSFTDDLPNLQAPFLAGLDANLAVKPVDDQLMVVERVGTVPAHITFSITPLIAAKPAGQRPPAQPLFDA